ncbi:hypothetical protein AAVH_27116 [Aphelenchoides avenae]|nr:hypothetical protein AAVH_27116 [Aphelenchus avenae]
MSGYPRGGSNTLVQIADVSADGYAGFNVVDTAAPITKLICKKPATPWPYDACSKFKTCT